ncbi:DUF1236 domain-containing protein [Azorhizobium caulinodans]|uniref:DUF1236 domain-containing protein n=1 Tax=Azorhizobium caulinodans TaxID=7 RepID=UPI002FBEB0C1
MSFRLPVAAALAAFAFPAAASAQSAVIVTQPQAVVTAPDTVVVLSPEQSTYVQRYVVAHPGPRASFTTTYQPVVGTELPAGVAIQTFTASDDAGFDTGRYGYVLTETNETVLVEPGTRRVIQVLR